MGILAIHGQRPLSRRGLIGERKEAGRVGRKGIVPRYRGDAIQGIREEFLCERRGTVKACSAFDKRTLTDELYCYCIKQNQ